MIARRMDSLTTQFFASLDERITALKTKGVDVIRLDVGSPDMPPAPFIVEALAKAAAKPDRHGYQPHTGNSALRQAWAEMYRREYGVLIDADREIMPLLGSKEGIFHLHQSLINSGDIVLIPDPAYLTYTQATRFAGGEAYYFPLLPERGFTPDFSAIPENVLSRAKLLWLNYPNNPTGASVGKEFFEEVISFSAQRGILVCHDAAYTQVTFDGYKAPSILVVPGAKETAVEFNTLSKSHNMAGWRVGAILGNQSTIKTLYRLKTNVDSGHFLPVMEAASAAMTQEQAWIAERNQIYQKRRDVLIAGLNKLGLQPGKPQASLYVWCPVPDGWTSAVFCEALLERSHVSVTPGTVFGACGEGFVRIAYTSPLERIEQALGNMSQIWASFERSAG
ncbi:MAG: aminotransferase class I/II-fold pyridoxal phosphate-dependent enzyme [Anaerolineales bacterium]|nr:aminotransferase class I/II-fold pyridoxal phosphate-dependent enzyme [Anaerolineales bacterium]